MNPLGEKWKWPSDHLPVGAVVNRVGSTLNPKETLRVISWNVLNSLSVHFISSDSQGLNGSDITKQNFVSSHFLTRREERVALLIIELMRSCDILCLQECSPLIMETVSKGMDHIFGEKAIGNHSTAGKYGDFGVIYYSRNRCKNPSSTTSTQFTYLGREQYLQSLYFPNAVVPILIFNTHWNVSYSSIKLRDVVFRFVPREITYPVLICGDMYQKEVDVLRELNQGYPHQFAGVNIPYFTSVNSERVPVDYDHICYLNGWTRCPEEDDLRPAHEVYDEQRELPSTRFYIRPLQADQFSEELEALITNLAFKVEVLIPIIEEEGPLPELPVLDQPKADRQ